MLEDQIALLIDRLIRHAHTSLHQRTKGLATERVQPSDGVLLIALGEIGPTPINQLAERLARHKSQVTRSIQKLEHEGLIRRTSSTHDARVSLLELSERGIEITDTLRHEVNQTLKELLAPLSNQERKNLRDLLQKALNREPPK
ncbi:MAG: MarR family transcriptional regulator [Pseudomonadota bacterium]